MNPFDNRCALRHRLAAAAMTLLLIPAAPAFAGPGAHGPNGEHLDGPTAARAASVLPRIEAKSELFELVAELQSSGLVILIDRYASNEPVLGAKLEVESGTLKATAPFRAEQGDYVVTDAAMLKTLAAPGEHGLVFTLLAGQENDLLDGTLVNAAGGVGAANDDHSHGNQRAAWIGAGVTTLGVLGGIVWWRLRRREIGKLQGGL